MRTPPMTTTFCPRLHRSPITAPGITWQKCQTLVPRPIAAPSSTYADSCTKWSSDMWGAWVGATGSDRRALAQQLVPLLQAAHAGGARAEREDRVARRARRRHRRGVRDAPRDGGLPQRVVVALGVLPHGRVDEEGHLAVHDEVVAVRAPLVDLEDAPAGDAAPAQVARGALGGDERE